MYLAGACASKKPSSVPGLLERNSRIYGVRTRPSRYLVTKTELEVAVLCARRMLLRRLQGPNPAAALRYALRRQSTVVGDMHTSGVWRDADFPHPEGTPAGFTMRACSPVPVNKEHGEVMLEKWEAGSAEPPHAHPGDDMTIVVEGVPRHRHFTPHVRRTPRQLLFQVRWRFSSSQTTCAPMARRSRYWLDRPG